MIKIDVKAIRCVPDKMQSKPTQICSKTLAQGFQQKSYGIKILF